MLPRWLLTSLTILISLVWAANVIVGLVDPARHDAALNAVFAIVVGASYGLSRKDIRSARQRLGLHHALDDEDERPEHRRGEDQ